MQSSALFDELIRQWTNLARLKPGGKISNQKGSLYVQNPENSIIGKLGQSLTRLALGESRSTNVQAIVHLSEITSEYMMLVRRIVMQNLSLVHAPDSGFVSQQEVKLSDERLRETQQYMWRLSQLVDALDPGSVKALSILKDTYADAQDTTPACIDLEAKKITELVNQTRELLISQDVKKWAVPGKEKEKESEQIPGKEKEKEPENKEKDEEEGT